MVELEISEEFQWVKNQYHRYFGEVYDTREKFEKGYMKSGYEYILKEWVENGVLLLDVCFEPMANEIVVVRLPPKEK